MFLNLRVSDLKFGQNLDCRTDIFFLGGGGGFFSQKSRLKIIHFCSKWGPSKELMMLQLGISVVREEDLARQTYPTFSYVSGEYPG